MVKPLQFLGYQGHLSNGPQSSKDGVEAKIIEAKSIEAKWVEAKSIRNAGICVFTAYGDEDIKNTKNAVRETVNG